MKYLRLILVVPFFVSPFLMKAQTVPGLVSRNVLLSSDTLILDTLIILRGSVQVNMNGSLLKEGKEYHIDYFTGRFINAEIPQGSEIQLQYRTIPLPLNQPKRHKELSLIHPEFKVHENPFVYKTGKTGELFDRDGLNMTGNIARGISLGNNQNVVVNSNLNLQFNGKLGDIEVQAVISDENNPIQPEGNTQQLQDFDRVFIRFNKDEHQVTVGDFEMIRPGKSYFMNYYKKSRGLQFQLPFAVARDRQLKIAGEGAVSRGRFARNIINGIEGNQGPYQLKGPNGELYIIVISGTEAVYLDGQKLARGEQHDYTIDYNSGEITFMPRRPVTQYSRVVVEFQYADRNYVRSVFHYETEYRQKQFGLRFNYFTEQDHKNQPFLQDLNDSNKQQLALAGDDLQKTFISGVTATAFSEGKVLYRKTDSLGFTSILVYAPAPGSDTVFYEAQFSYVGESSGNYILQTNGTNGRVYRWVAPLGGVPQGNYEPITQLVTPKRNQMISLGTDIQLGKQTTFTLEYARSQFDQNTFSELDGHDDAGNGIRFQLQNTFPFSDQAEDSWNLQSTIAYEQVDGNFRYIERYRTVEFDRTWNRLLQNTTAQDTAKDERILSTGLNLNHAQFGSVFYTLGMYNRSGSLSGLQHQAGTDLRYKSHALLSRAEWLNTHSSNTDNRVSALKLDYSKAIRGILAGTRYETEQSLYRSFTDTLLTGSYAYDQYAVYLKRKDSLALAFQLEYKYREDYLPLNIDMLHATTGQQISAATQYTQTNQNRLSLEINYREFSLHNSSLTSYSPEKTILTRIEYDYGFLQRVFTGNAYWQAGSGNELRRDFQFVKVPVGQGMYLWKDFNDDGLQTTNEFVLAAQADKVLADYIRIYLPSNTVVRINSNQFNQTLNINPSAVWGNKRGWKKTAARFSDLLAYKTDRKTNDLNTGDFLNPFIKINDSLIISHATVFKNTLFYNRSNPEFGCDYSYLESRSKQFLIYGFDTKSRFEQTLNARWNLNSSIGTLITGNWGERNSYSDFFTENNYVYTYLELKPRLLYQATTKLRITFIYAYTESQTPPAYRSLKGLNQETGLEVRFQPGTSGILNLKFNRYQIKFDGNMATPLGYDMFQGMQAGINSLWGINFQQMLGSNIQVSLNYDGRKSENRAIIHTGKMEARYLF